MNIYTRGDVFECPVCKNYLETPTGKKPTRSLRKLKKQNQKGLPTRSFTTLLGLSSHLEKTWQQTLPRLRDDPDEIAKFSQHLIFIS